MENSIHPRNWKDGNRQKLNTAKSRKRKSYGRKEERLRIRLDDWLKTIAALKSSHMKTPSMGWESAFHRPGSMNS